MELALRLGSVARFQIHDEQRGLAKLNEREGEFSRQPSDSLARLDTAHHQRIRLGSPDGGANLQCQSKGIILSVRQSRVSLLRRFLARRRLTGARAARRCCSLSPDAAPGADLVSGCLWRGGFELNRVELGPDGTPIVRGIVRKIQVGWGAWHPRPRRTAF